jgi:hypothetical protein
LLSKYNERKAEEAKHEGGASHDLNLTHLGVKHSVLMDELFAEYETINQGEMK